MPGPEFPTSNGAVCVGARGRREWTDALELHVGGLRAQLDVHSGEDGLRVVVRRRGRRVVRVFPPRAQQHDEEHDDDHAEQHDEGDENAVCDAVRVRTVP